MSVLIKIILMIALAPLIVTLGALFLGTAVFMTFHFIIDLLVLVGHL